MMDVDAEVELHRGDYVPSVHSYNLRIQHSEKKINHKIPSASQTPRPAPTPVLQPNSKPTSSPASPKLETMSVRQLRLLLVHMQLSEDGCIEKKDLIDKIGKKMSNGPVNTVKEEKKTNPKTPAVDGILIAELERIERYIGIDNCHYQVLGLKASEATSDSIKIASRKLFRLVHPDKVSLDLKTRAEKVFHCLNESVVKALSDLTKSKAKLPPRVAEMRSNQEPGGNAVVLRWRMPNHLTVDSRPEKFLVLASGGGLTVDQGFVANQTSSDDGQWIEFAISTVSRKGNDELFKRRIFNLSVIPVNQAGNGPQADCRIVIDSGKVLGSLSGPLPGLRRHNTFA